MIIKRSLKNHQKLDIFGIFHWKINWNFQTTLECAPHNVKFYEKIGYKDAGETYMEIRF